MKALLGQSHLGWNPNKKQGAYSGAVRRRAPRAPRFLRSRRAPAGAARKPMPSNGQRARHRRALRAQVYDHNLEHGAALKKVANTACPRDAAEGAAPRAPLQQRNPSAENPRAAAGAARARGGARPQPTSPDSLDTWMGAAAADAAGGAAERQRRFSQAGGGEQQHGAGPRYRLDGGAGYGERAGYDSGRAEPERAAPGSFGDPRAYGLPGADAEQQLRELLVHPAVATGTPHPQCMYFGLRCHFST